MKQAFLGSEDFLNQPVNFYGQKLDQLKLPFADSSWGKAERSPGEGEGSWWENETGITQGAQSTNYR